MFDSQKKLHLIRKQLLPFKSAGVAFSGGIDSAFLLKLCSLFLPVDQVHAFHITSVFQPAKLLNEIKELYTAIGLLDKNLHIIEIFPLKKSEIKRNDNRRCYHCKKYMYTLLKKQQKHYAIDCIMDGTNFDDLQQERPGIHAILEENILTPLADSFFSKINVRTEAEKLGLSNFDKPSNSCLATRIMPNSQLEEKHLMKIDVLEDILCDFGYSGCRVRPVTENIIIELPDKHFREVQKAGNMLYIKNKFYEYDKRPLQMKLRNSEVLYK